MAEVFNTAQSPSEASIWTLSKLKPNVHGSRSDSLRGATSRGKLWLPATVTIANGHLRVSTSERIDEFRPRRIVWKGPDSFLVTGLSHNSELRRSVLRFRSAEVASNLGARTTLATRTHLEWAKPAVDRALEEGQRKSRIPQTRPRKNN